jgi:Cu2+-exporting ATPase
MPRGIELSLPEKFDSIAGHGVEALVDERPVLIGNKKLMDREKVSLDGLEERVYPAEVSRLQRWMP